MGFYLKEFRNNRDYKSEQQSLFIRHHVQEESWISKGTKWSSVYILNWEFSVERILHVRAIAWFQTVKD